MFRAYDQSNLDVISVDDLQTLLGQYHHIALEEGKTQEEAAELKRAINAILDPKNENLLPMQHFLDAGVLIGVDRFDCSIEARINFETEFEIPIFVSLCVSSFS